MENVNSLELVYQACTSFSAVCYVHKAQFYMLNQFLK